MARDQAPAARRRPKGIVLVPTCVVDALGPSVRASAEAVLGRLGTLVRRPRGVACCGQVAHNLGEAARARDLARPTLRALDRAEGPVVVLSGSCATMIRHQWPALFAGTRWAMAAKRVAGRAVELSEYLAGRVLAGDAVAGQAGGPATWPQPVAPLVSCHLARHLGVVEAPARLLEQQGHRVVATGDDDRCCGFGGAFSVSYPEVSAAMADEKLDAVVATGARTVSACDLSCLVHLEARAQVRGTALHFAHLAELLAGPPPSERSP